MISRPSSKKMKKKHVNDERNFPINRASILCIVTWFHSKPRREVLPKKQTSPRESKREKEKKRLIGSTRLPSHRRRILRKAIFCIPFSLSLSFTYLYSLIELHRSSSLILDLIESPGITSTLWIIRLEFFFSRESNRLLNPPLTTWNLVYRFYRLFARLLLVYNYIDSIPWFSK